MKPSLPLAIAVVALAFTLQGCVTAGQTRGTQYVTTNTKLTSKDTLELVATEQQFDAEVAAIDQQMEPGGRWRYVKPPQRATIDVDFADMRGLYARFGNVARMPTSARGRMADDSKAIAALLTDGDTERLVCHVETPVGSHMRARVCETYGQIQADKAGRTALPHSVTILH